MIPQQNEISSSPPPFKKIKLPLVNNNNTTLITSNNKETSSVTFTKKKNILKLNQFELFKILSFLTNERNSILKMLCLNKTIFNEIFNEKTLQENINHFILRNENIFVTIILSIFFNYKLNLFVNNEIYNTLQKHFPHQPINKDNIFITLQNYLNNNLYNNTITKNVDFYCNDGEEQFSNDTMIYREEDDDFLQFEFNLQKSKVDDKRICYSSLQNENYLLFSNLKNTLNRLRNCFDFLTCHIQSLQSYFYKKEQWSTWLNEINVDNNNNESIQQYDNEKLQNIKHELNTKIFDKVNFVKVKKSDIFDFHICITKYKIGDNLEFKYNAVGYDGNPFDWTLKYKVYNTNYNDEIFTLIESDTNKITINLHNLYKIKTILQIDNNLVSNELLIEAILISSPQWNILEFIEEDFNITSISFDHNKIITTTYEENNKDNNIKNNEDVITNIIGDITMVDQKNQMNEIKFTITDLPIELLNYICNYLFYLKDGLSFGLVSKDIYNSIYYNNNLFIPNKITKDNFIPLIMTTIYSEFNQQKLLIKNKECDNSTKEQMNDFCFDLSLNNCIGDLNEYDNYYFKLFTTNLQRIEHFIGYIDSLQRYIYVKQFEFNNFLKEINNNYIAQQLNDKIFKKLIYQSSRINAIDDQWHYKALYNINNCIYFEQKIHVVDYGDPTMYWKIKIKSENKFLEEIFYGVEDLLKNSDEKQFRKCLDLKDERVTIDLILKSLQYCSPFKFEFIEYCEENNSH
ncbi:hypothetical protein ABK040_010548 [Willaertia magna]